MVLVGCFSQDAEALQRADSAATSEGGRGRAAMATFTQRSDSAGERRYQAVNRRFLFVGEAATDTSVLVRETLTRNCCWQSEKSSLSTIMLDGWVGRTRFERAPDWTVSFQADEGELREYSGNPFYRANLHGCCDSADLLTFINLRSGKARFFLSLYGDSAGAELVEAWDWRNRVSRFAAFHDSYTESDPPEGKNQKDVVGVLQYGPADGPVHRVVVRHTSGPGNDYRLDRIGFIGTDTVPEARLNVGDDKKPHSVAEGFSGIAIIVSLDGMDSPWVVLRVPITRDRLDLDHAVVPSGFTIR